MSVLPKVFHPNFAVFAFVFSQILNITCSFMFSPASSFKVQSRAVLSMTANQQLSLCSNRRIFFNKVAGTALSISVFSGSLKSASALESKFDSYSREDLQNMVAEGRKELDKCNSLIKEAKWDSVRTILKRQPLAEISKVIVSLAKKSPDEEEIILGYKNDAAFHLQMLDTFVYNNVFVGEDRQILGTKVDFNTPLDELGQSKEALDSILEIVLES